MSQENVEIVGRSAELWLRGEIDAWRETIDPEIGWDISAHPLPDVPNHGRGADAFLLNMGATYLSGWNDYAAEVVELIDADDDNVVVVLHETARMRGTGVPLDRDLILLWTVAGQRVAFLRVFKTKAEALEVAGLSA